MGQTSASHIRFFLIPMVAMPSLPLGIIGIFPGHWNVGTDFSATSMVGIIALAGVVIRLDVRRRIRNAQG